MIHPATDLKGRPERSRRTSFLVNGAKPKPCKGEGLGLKRQV